MKTYTKAEIETKAAELIDQLRASNPDVGQLELAALLLYASSFILYVSLELNETTNQLTRSASIAFSLLTNPPEYATLPEPEEDGEVSPTDREASKDVAGE